MAIKRDLFIEVDVVTRWLKDQGFRRLAKEWVAWVKKTKEGR